MMRYGVFFVIGVCGVICSGQVYAQESEVQSPSRGGVLGDDHREPLRTMRFMIGFPWSGVRVDWELAEKVLVFAEVDSARRNRFQPTLGLRWDVARRGLNRFGVELGAGYQLQYGELAQRGVSAVGQLGGELGGERAFVYSWVQSRHTMLLNQRVVTTSTGEERSLEAVHRWTPGFALGIGTRAGEHNRARVQVGLDWRFADVGYLGFSLPGAHMMISFGW